MSALLQCLSPEHVGLLPLLCSLKGHFKACDFCKDKKLHERRKDALQLRSALLPSQDFHCDLLGRACVEQPEHPGWLWMCELWKNGKTLVPPPNTVSLPQKLG